VLAEALDSLADIPAVQGEQASRMSSPTCLVAVARLAVALAAMALNAAQT